MGMKEDFEAEDKPKRGRKPQKNYRCIHPSRIFFDGFSMGFGDRRKMFKSQAEAHLKAGRLIEI